MSTHLNQILFSLGVIVIVLEVASINAQLKICQKKDGKFSKSGSSCKEYYQCSDGVPIEKRCPSGNNFNVEVGSCDWALVYPCREDVVGGGYRCPSMFGVFTFPKDCSMYYECWMNKPKIKTCKREGLFDGKRKKCALKELVDCGSRFNPYGPSTTTATTTFTSSTPSEDEYKKTTILETFPPTSTNKPSTADTTYTTSRITTRDTTLREKVTFTPEIVEVTTSIEQNVICPKPFGHFPHPTDEHKFVVCDNNVPSIFNCPANLIYNDKINQCDYKS